MPRGVKKENLPAKICVVCERPFTWRKKWERCWDEVTTCSKSCNRKRREKKNVNTVAIAASTEETAEQLEIETDSLCSNDVGQNELFEMIRTELQLDTEADTAPPNTAPPNTAKADSDTTSGKEDDSSADEDKTDAPHDPKARAKAERKAAKKAKKAARRAQREGRGDPTVGQKPCDMCGKSVDLLIRCTYDASGEWKMVCGKCWQIASGGVADGDAQHPHYRYGGLWKNRRRR